jgi:hypothetical protein
MSAGRLHASERERDAEPATAGSGEPAVGPLGSLTQRSLLALQRSAGNRAVGATLSRQARSGTASPPPVQGRGPARARTSSAGRRLLMRTPRDPDIVRNGSYTWYVGMGSEDRVFALQIGEFTDFRPGRLALRIATLRPGTSNPQLASRTMLLAVPASTSLAPKITAETQTRTPDGNGYQRTIELELVSGSSDSLPVGVILLYRDALEQVPFHDPGAYGSAVWRRLRLQSGYAAASDGLHEMAANFPSIHPRGSLFAPGTSWFQHPRLGIGRLLPNRIFVPMPRMPVISDEVIKDVARTYIHMVPVVGSLVMVGEALVGRDIWGRQLSTTERVILGAGALLAEVGAAVRAGRSVAAASRVSRVAGVGRIQALRMVVASRSLTQAERDALARFSSKIKAGEALTEAEQTLANRIIGKLGERMRVQAIRAELEAATGAARRPGRFTDMSTAVSREEQRVGEALARDLNADVVRPPDLPGTAATQGMKNPDYFVDDLAAELVSPRSGNVERVLDAVQRKHRQAGLVVVDLTHSQTISAELMVGNAHRLWQRASFADVRRLIIVKDTRVVAELARPVSRSAAPRLIRGAASLGSQLTRPREGGEEPPPSRSTATSGGGFHTQTIELAGSGQAIHLQIGRQPDFHPGRLSIRFAPARSGYRTLPVEQRTMLLAASPQTSLSPRVVEEQDGDRRRKMLTLQLNGSSSSARVSIAIAVEDSRIYVYATDRTNDIRIYFPIVE